MATVLIDRPAHDLPDAVQQAIAKPRAGFYFQQKVNPPTSILWTPIFTVIGVVVSLAFGALIFPIFIAIGILIWGAWSIRQMRRNNAAARAALAEAPFLRGLYVSDDYLLFYLSPAKVMLLPHDFISDVEYIVTFATNSDTEDEDASRSKHYHLAFYVQHNGAFYQVVWRNFDKGLADPNGAVNAVVDHITQQWQIPYHRLDNRDAVQTPPAYTAHPIQFTKVY